MAERAHGDDTTRSRTWRMARRCRIAAAALGLALATGGTAAEEQALERLMEPFTGDFEQMVERRIVRALVTYSRTFYFLDGPQPRGLDHDLLTGFERHLNDKLATRHLRVHVTIVPVRRDQLIPYLLEGRGDLAVANLTITAQRREKVDFSTPTLTGVDEILVTAPGVEAPGSAAGLAGATVHVRRSSSYYQSLIALNERLLAAGREPVRLRIADEPLEDEDLLEMMNAGLIPRLIVDSHKAALWVDVLPRIQTHPEVKLREDAKIAWAMRKNSPELKAVVDEFIGEHRKGTLVGNILFNRYLKENEWVKNPLAGRELARFQEVLDLFKRYAGRYDFDPLLIAALAYQESGLDQSKRSPDGAVGIMQILPSTAADENVGVANIEKRENNVHAGVKYLRFIADRYFDDADIDPLNRTLLAFAAYNAGPRRVAELRERAAARGLDPDVWFDNVEVIAARKIGRETVRYVSNIYKYYVAYRLANERLDEKEEVLGAHAARAPFGPGSRGRVADPAHGPARAGVPLPGPGARRCGRRDAAVA